MDKGFAVLEIDPEFKTLIRPLRKDEYLQLEVNLAVDGCREPIITWNNIIVDGHNRYEICNRLHIPYAIREMPFENREQAIVWICSNQLGRRNITEETRRYLIGKQYELEKVARKHPPNINGFNQYKRRNKGERGDTFRRTAQKFSAQYNVSTGSVQKYAIFSKALDVVGQADPELPGKVLSGTFKISHENLVALSKMPPEEIRRIGARPEDLQHLFTSYSDTRKEFADTDEEPVEPMQETLPLIKITPMHDPDAEIAGLTLTVPSWVSSIERARNNADMNAAITTGEGVRDALRYQGGRLMQDFSRFVPNVHFEQIPIKNLVSNQEYQRPLSQAQVEKAIEDFDLNQINPVKVSRRDGVNYVFNGQHTIEIVATVSGSRETPVWCMIYDSLDYKNEADIFANQMKHVRPLKPYEIFMANIEAGNEQQLVIKRLVESYSLSIGPTKAYGMICAVATLERIYTKYGYHVLDRTLRLCVGTWEGDIDSLGANVLAGVAKMVVAFGDQLRDETFKEKVGFMSVRQLSRIAKERGAGSLGYAEAMLVAYNRKCKYTLRMTKLHSGKVAVEDDFVEENEEPLADDPVLEE